MTESWLLEMVEARLDELEELRNVHRSQAAQFMGDRAWEAAGKAEGLQISITMIRDVVQDWYRDNRDS